MNKTYSLAGVQAILAYPFKVPGWQTKLVIGAAVFFAHYIIPILPSILLLGYSAKIMRDMIVNNAEPTLPEWDDWGNLFSVGLKVFGATFVYMLPVIILLVGGYMLMLAPAFLTPFFIALGSSNSAESFGRIFGLEMLGAFSGMFFFGIGFLLFIPIALVLPPALAHVIAKNSFNAAFRIKEWWAIARANLWGFVTAIIIVSGIYIILILIVQALYFTVILCALLPVVFSVATIYMSVISAVLLADAYRTGVENLAAAATV